MASLSAQTRLVDLSRATSSDYPVPCPEGLAYLPFQVAGVEFALRVKHVLIADDMGLGKTVQAVGVCNALKAKKILVVCPATLQKNWQKEIDKWLVHDAQVSIYSYNKLVNPDAVKIIMSAGPYDVLIFDECHYLKNPKAKRTKYALAKNGLVSSAKKVVALSGTPIQNRPMEIFPITKRLCPEAIDDMDWFSFGKKYCAGWLTPWGAWDFTGASNLEALSYLFRNSFMVRRTKDAVLKDLPEKFRSLVYVADNSKGKQAVSKLATLDAETIIKNGSATVGFTEISEARRELGEAKVDFAIDYIKTQLEAGHKKIIVFAHHTTVIDKLIAELDGFNPAFVKGGMTNEKKNAAVEKFQTDSTSRIFVGSLMAAKEGLTLTAASYVIFVEFSWSPMDNEQAMDRAHRIGQKNNVVVDFLVHENSLDERIAKFNVDKTKIIREFGQ